MTEDKKAVSKLGRTIFAILIVLSGVIVFNYPTIATFVNNFFASKEVSEYEEKVEQMDTSELDRMMDLAYAYNASLPRNYPADPFSGTNIFDFTGTEFETFEMVQPDALIGYCEVPKIGVYLAVYYGTSDEVLGKSLGLVENTSLPVGGPGTHAVISGHSGLASKKLFTDLTRMEEGDLFFIHVLNKHFAYEVDKITVVLPDETKELAIEKDKDLVTLLTCTPFGINDHRLLVRGKRVDYDFSVKKKDVPILSRENPNRQRWIIAFGGAAAFLLLVIIKVIHDRRKDKRLEMRRKEEQQCAEKDEQQ